MKEWFRAWLQYRIVHLQILWKRGSNFHKVKGTGLLPMGFAGPYITRWKWVDRLLERVDK